MHLESILPPCIITGVTWDIEEKIVDQPGLSACLDNWLYVLEDLGSEVLERVTPHIWPVMPGSDEQAETVSGGPVCCQHKQPHHAPARLHLLPVPHWLSCVDFVTVLSSSNGGTVIFTIINHFSSTSEAGLSRGNGTACDPPFLPFAWHPWGPVVQHDVMDHSFPGGFLQLVEGQCQPVVKVPLTNQWPDWEKESGPGSGPQGHGYARLYILVHTPDLGQMCTITRYLVQQQESYHFKVCMGINFPSSWS